MRTRAVFATIPLLLSAAGAQGAIIKASLDMFIADRTAENPVYELGQGHLVFDTEESLLLDFYAESESYTFAMRASPLFVYWDVHLYPDNPILNYAYGGGNGGAVLSRRNVTAGDVDCVFQFYGEAQTVEFDDNFNVLFESGDGFMDIWMSAGGTSPAPDFEISLDIPSSKITRLHAVPEPSALGLLALSLLTIMGRARLNPIRRLSR